jgi:hypothetical protein
MRQDKLIWFALVFSTVIYAAIIYTLYPNPQGSFEDSLKRPYTLILYGMALLDFLLGLVLPSLQANRPPRLRMVVSMAIFESSVIFGLIAAFFAQDWRVFVPTWALGLMGMWRMYPSDEVSATPEGRARV